MLGQDLTSNPSKRRKAQQRIKEARLVFTTCTGASLGLLRDEQFDIVLIDEASQLTEPATLVPLVKGCSRAILVGDHVQLRATVQQTSLLVAYDVSLFERHYSMQERKGVAKVMLSIQYRMHRTICYFSSTEFYGGGLNTTVADESRPLPVSQFPWPEDNRLVWIEISSPEDFGQRSKANSGQTELCKRVVQLLTSPVPDTSPQPAEHQQQSLAILTPYTRQKEALSSTLTMAEASSIDGFQGREADIVIFVTVRCNASCDIGFLADIRRLNVVMTRAKCGVVIIGNKETLTGGIGAGDNLEESKKVWQRLAKRCHTVQL
jgi:superfamily I DNA and/or RNA helicase